MNKSILDDKLVLESLSHTLALYFQTNMQGEVSNQAVWEAHKVGIRGELISHGSRIRKERQREIVDLLEEIHNLEVKHKAHLDPADVQKLETLWGGLSQCLDQKAKNKHRYFAHCFYEQGNKGVS